MDISIITTVFNSEKYINECMNCIQDQLNIEDLEIEHIIIDDGSTDNTKKIVHNYLTRYPNILYYEAGKVGRGRALNIGIDHSKAKYIAILDSDDLFLPTKLSKQWAFMNEHPECDFACTKSITFHKEILISNEIDNSYEVINHSLLKKNIINHSSVIFRRDILLEIDKYDERRTAQLDLELWLRYLYKYKKIFMMNEILSGKRIHKDQNFEKKNRVKYLLKSAFLKFNYIIKMKKYKYIPHVFIRLFVGLLPESLRSKFR